MRNRKAINPLLYATLFLLIILPLEISAATLTVPDDYPTIQAAIDAASTGDAVYVKEGTYYENVFIGKQITLQGEDRETTIIDGGGIPYVDTSH